MGAVVCGEVRRGSGGGSGEGKGGRLKVFVLRPDRNHSWMVGPRAGSQRPGGGRGPQGPTPAVLLSQINGLWWAPPKGLAPN